MKTCFQSTSSLLHWLLPCSLLVAGVDAQAADKPAPGTGTATRHELWVPTAQWKTVLAKHPNAVMLTPEQYEALIRDAGKVKTSPTDENLPERALIESLHFKGNAADENASEVKLEGEMTIRCFTDEWSEVTARLPFTTLTSATVDGNLVLGLSADIKSDPNQSLQRKLLVRGKGVHHLTVQVLDRSTADSFDNTRSLNFQTVNVPAVLDLQLPRGSVITRSEASYTREGDVAHVLLDGVRWEQDHLAWTTSSALHQPALQRLARGGARVTDHSIESTWTLGVQPSSDDATGHLAFEVIPPEATVLSVTGEGIAHWQQADGKLEVTLQDKQRSTTLRAEMESRLDLQTSDTAQSVVMPALRFVGQLNSNMRAEITVGSPEVVLMEYQGGTLLAQGRVDWNPVRDTLKLLLRKADPRVTVDADTHIEVTSDDVQFNRTLRVQTDRPMSELRVTLPAGEEFIGTNSIQEPSVDWKQVGQVLEYRWAQGLAAQQTTMLALQSRKRLTNGGGVPTASSITVESLAIAEAKKLAGYVALDFDPTWRVAVKKASGLEERDAGLTPVRGKMAWFGLRVFSLAFEVQRREPVFDAEIAAYALPRVKTVDIEGQITLEVSDAPLRQLKVGFTPEQAVLVRFTSPFVGEQTLEAASGVWSLTLRKESMGQVPLRFRLSLPAGGKTSAPEDANVTIDAKLPAITVNGARRSHGVWVVEANTDTELTFVPQAMQPLDVLHAPVIEDYQPRHRVVAAFDYASPESTLTLHAARHEHSELAALVVSSMHLTSVLGRDGSSRHEAVLSVTHSGEQFITVNLPQGSSLITTLADHQPVKPVRGPNGSLSIPLPPGSANDSSVDVRLLYERTAEAWASRGQQRVDPPTLPGNIPVLATDWQVYVPDGYSFKKVQTALEQGGAEPERQAILNADMQENRPQMLMAAPASEVRLSPSAAAPGSIKTTEEEQRHLQQGSALSDQGNYDEALKEFQAALHIDPYNVAARRGMQRVEQRKAHYYYSARDHQRAPVIYQADEAWEDKPTAPASPKPGAGSNSNIVARELKVPPDFIQQPGVGTRLSHDAIMQILTASGVLNVENTEMVYHPEAGELMVKGTPETVRLVGDYIRQRSAMPKQEKRKQGLLPLEIDLPAAGKLLRFHGPQAPTSLALLYVSEDWQIINAMAFMLAGAALFLFWGWQRPVLASLLAFLILAFGIGLITEEWQPLADATLLGWFIAVALAALWRLVKAFDAGVIEGRQA